MVDPVATGSASFISSTSGTGTRELASFIAELTIDDIPEDVLERSGYLALDGLGCAAAGVVSLQYLSLIHI